MGVTTGELDPGKVQFITITIPGHEMVLNKANADMISAALNGVIAKFENDFPGQIEVEVV